MSSTVQIAPPRASLSTLPLDQRRGIDAMWAVIATEGMLFACMFAAYYYLGSNKDRWSIEVPPKLYLALILAAILISSSFVLHWGEKQVKAARFGAARAAVWITIFVGLIFLGVQGYEYYDHWKELAPYSNSYGSTFYAITSLHAAHVIAGLGLLAFLGVVPRYGETQRTPHRPYTPISMYWHFVDIVWLFIVTLLYIVPQFLAIHHAH
ncbi:MAG: cytochrome c oxidase subunit 3 [Terracidiphilus sp.]